jgi:hypothetical protein
LEAAVARSEREVDQEVVRSQTWKSVREVDLREPGILISVPMNSWEVGLEALGTSLSVHCAVVVVEPMRSMDYSDVTDVVVALHLGALVLSDRHL